MKYFLIIIFLFTSCDEMFDWGATASTCDEICTVYNAVSLEIMAQHNLNYSNFPREEEYRKHILGNNSNFKVDSYFFEVSKNNDTIIHRFSCKVFYDQELTNYKVDSLKIK